MNPDHSRRSWRWRRVAGRRRGVVRSLVVVLSTVAAAVAGAGLAAVPSPAPAAAVSPAPNGFIVFNDDSANLYSVDTRPGGPYTLTNLTAAGAGNGVKPQVSPSGNRIAFEWQGDIYTVNIDGTGRTQLTTGGDAASCWTEGCQLTRRHAPTWSPDGNKIAYARNNPYMDETCEDFGWYLQCGLPYIPYTNEYYSGRWFIDVMDADGTDLVQVRQLNTEPRSAAADHPYDLDNVTHLEWSPDGNHIAARGRMDTKYADNNGLGDWSEDEFSYNSGYAHFSTEYSTRVPRSWTGNIWNFNEKSAYRKLGHPCYIANPGISDFNGDGFPDWPSEAAWPQWIVDACPTPQVRDSGIVLFNADGSGSGSLQVDALDVGRPTFLAGFPKLLWSDRGTNAEAHFFDSMIQAAANVVLTAAPRDRVVMSNQGSAPSPHPLIPVGADEPVVSPDGNFIGHTVGNQILARSSSQTVTVASLGFTPRNLDWGSAPTRGSLAKNSGFEAGGSAWSMMPGTSSNFAWYSSGQMGAPARSGNRYGATNTTGAGGGIYQDAVVPSSPGELYCASAWVRTQYPATGASGAFRVGLLGGAYVESGQVAFSGLGNGSNWQQVQACVNATTAHTAIRIEFFPTPGGPTLDIDDVDVHRSLAMNASFEGGTSSWTMWPTHSNFTVYQSGQQAIGEYARSGNRYAATNATLSGGGFYQDVAVPTSPGERICVSAWLRTQFPDTGASGSLMVWLQGGAYEQPGGTAFSGLGYLNNWQQVEACVTATTAHTSLRIRFYPTPGKTLHIDDVDLH